MEKKIILSPFCLNSVFFYEKKYVDNQLISLFFDMDLSLHNCRYKNIPVFKRFYLPNTMIILCSENMNTNYAIKEELLKIGYLEDDIIFMNQLSENDKINLSINIDLEQYQILKPNKDYEYSKIKRYRRLNELKIVEPIESFEIPTFKDVINNKYIFLHTLDFMITYKCSLRCKKCTNGMQYIENPCHVEINQCISDYNRILEIVEWIGSFIILGGEPLLHKELYILINKIKNNPETRKKIGNIIIISNGTMIPDKKLLNELRDSNIILKISNYKEKSNKIMEIVKLCNENNVKCVINDIPNWSDSVQYYNSNGVDKEKLIKYRKECIIPCRSLSNGKFFVCSLANTLVNICAVPYNPKNYVNIYNENAEKEIMKYMDRNTPMPDVCSWCTGMSESQWYQSTIPVAEQSKEVLLYKKYI